MDTPTLLPQGVGSLSAPPPLDISSMTDMAVELTRPVDRAQLDQDIKDFNISYPVNLDDALNLFSLPHVAGVGTALTNTTTTPPVTTTSTRTRPVTSTRTRPVTATSTRSHIVHQPTMTRHFHHDTSHYHCTRPSTCRSRDIDHHVHHDGTKYTSQNRCQATTTTSRRAFTLLSSTV